MVPLSTKGKKGSEAIKVCVRVRPLLSHEQNCDEVVYYPNQNDPSLQPIRIADGQHLVESQYDRVFNQYSTQQEVFNFVN